MHDVNWDLLPDQPQAFFGLEDGFDRRALKKSYNQRLKQFKPEQFPDEFKRIRAAYESLDEGLRYGREISAIAKSNSYRWQATSATQTFGDSADKPSTVAGTTATNRSIPDRLKTEAPEAIYRELSSMRSKAPYDYYCLALISDVVQRDKTMFVRWLLTGIEKGGEDPGLLSILKAYFESNIEIQSVPRLLLATSKAIKSDLFFYLTESVWKRLLREVPFEQFRKTLQACESNLKGFQIRNRLVFYLAILRQAIWVGDSEWLLTASDFISQNARELPVSLEAELYFLEVLQKYHASLPEQRTGEPIRESIRQTIKSYCLEPPEIGDRKVIELQTRLGHDGGNLLRVFPAVQDQRSENDQDVAMFQVWQMVNEEVADRHGIERNPVSIDRFMDRLFSLMADMESAWNDQLFGMIVGILFFLIPYAALVGGCLTIVVMAHMVSPALGLLSIFGSVAMALAFHFFIRAYTIDLAVRWLVARMVFKTYRKHWRSRLLSFLEAMQVNVGQLQQGLMHVVNERESRLSASTWLVQFIPLDLGLAFYSEAIRFRR